MSHAFFPSKRKIFMTKIESFSKIQNSNQLIIFLMKQKLFDRKKKLASIHNVVLSIINYSDWMNQNITPLKSLWVKRERLNENPNQKQISIEKSSSHSS